MLAIIAAIFLKAPNTISILLIPRYELQRCLEDIHSWMAANKLKLNPEKTEFILFGTDKQRSTLSSLFPIDILGAEVSVLQQAKFKIWVSFSTVVSPFRTMYPLSANRVLLVSVTYTYAVICQNMLLLLLQMQQ